MKKRGWLLTGVLLALSTVTVLAADWPQWRGPHRDGISQETGLLKAWPKDGPKLLWQVTDLGDGYSTPAVVGDRLYVISSKGMDNEYVEARAIKKGQPIWTRQLGKVGANTPKASYPGSRSTPTIEGERLYVMGSDGDLACLDTAKGEVRWRKNVRTDFGGRPGYWAFSESPLIDGDKLIITPGGPQAALVALDKTTGNVIWKATVPGADQAAYSSVISMEPAGGPKQYVQFLEKGLVGIEAQTGKFLWRYDHSAAGSLANIPTPIAKDSYVYSSTGQGGGGLVKLQSGPDGITAKEIYFSKQLPTSIGGAVLLDGFLYGTNGQGLMCVEFTTGKQRWQNKSVGAASICYAEGRLYLHGENGEAALVEASPEAYRELGRFTPPDQPEHALGKSQKAWAYPVVANGRFYLRDLNCLWCYEIKAR